VKQITNVRSSPKADIDLANRNVRLVPKADISIRCRADS
jgi:hypothetical protein